VNLYWVETADHAEDWFVVARSEKRAARWHERAEGYDGDGEAWATFVVPVPGNIQAPEGWPTHELLAACGARLLRVETPRVVDIDGRRFVEGYLEHEILRADDERLEALGRGRPNGTKRSSMH
jgi:hypothetical protein